jgi:hypothetical protein
LPGDTSPEAGLTLLRERKDLLVKFDEWRIASDKSQSATTEITRYEQALSEKGSALGISGETTEALEAALWKTLAEARKAQERHDQLSQQIEQAGSELADSQVLASQADQTLLSLVQMAGLATVEGLEPLLAHLEQRDAVEARIDGLRDTLSGLARGQAVDDFVSKVCAENPDALAERKAIATREKLENEAALPAIRETLFRLPISASRRSPVPPPCGRMPPASCASVSPPICWRARSSGFGRRIKARSSKSRARCSRPSRVVHSAGCPRSSTRMTSRSSSASGPTRPKSRWPA